jgi:hypothetical protein
MGENMNLFEFDDIIFGVDNTWSNDYCFGIRGFLFSKKEQLTKAVLDVGGNKVEITNWHARADIEKKYQTSGHSIANCGFAVQIETLARHEFVIHAYGTTKYSKKISLDGQKPSIPQIFSDIPDGLPLFGKFIDEVNRNELSVLEIGSRIVGALSSSNRKYMSKAREYIGLDIYEDSNTNIVGDCHQLSKIFKNKKFDAIFSLVVFEHIAMPWVVAMEINKALNMGGITYHQVPFAWPLHEIPWDFWRMSHYGLKVLFSSALGFEVIDAGLSQPVSIHFREVIDGQEDMPLMTSYAASAILAKKIGNIDNDKFRWDISMQEVLEKDSYYPKKNTNT